MKPRRKPLPQHKFTDGLNKLKAAEKDKRVAFVKCDDHQEILFTLNSLRTHISTKHPFVFDYFVLLFCQFLFFRELYYGYDAQETAPIASTSFQWDHSSVDQAAPTNSKHDNNCHEHPQSSLV